MLTKKDLNAIQAMFDDAKKGIVSQVTSQVTSQIISKVSAMIQKNTDDLVELITVGFNAQDAGFRKFDKIIANHEKRITMLEEISYKSN